MTTNGVAMKVSLQGLVALPHVIGELGEHDPQSIWESAVPLWAVTPQIE
jgi:hypothetical protein